MQTLILGKRKSYQSGFTLKVRNRGEEDGNPSAERQFRISEKFVRGRRKQKYHLKETLKSKGASKCSVSPYRNMQK